MTEPRSTRTGASPILQILLEPGADTPLYRQLYEALRTAIVRGRLRPGERLPATRTLASDLGIARNTVLLAYEQLRAEGYLAGHLGGGTRVRASIPDELLTSRRRKVSKATSASSASTAAPPRPQAPQVARISRRGALLGATGRGAAQATGTAPVPFELGVSAIDAFPTRLWWRLAGRRWRQGTMSLASGDPAGELALREAIAAYVQRARGAVCTPAQVLVTSGAQQALHLVAQVLLDEGDRVWLENPGYAGARAVFEAAGAALVPVPLDEEGLDVTAGVAAAPDARLAYVTPSHQFPLGVVMSAARRLRLLSWARSAGAWVVEDDYDSEFRYQGRPLPCLQGLDAESAQPCVLYVGTFSKTLAPALRLGYLVVPESLVDAFRAARSLIDGHSPVADQRVLADFIGEGHYARHVRRVRALCAERQAVLLDAAHLRLCGLLELAPDPAGLHLVADVVAPADAAAVCAAAASAGLRISSLSGSVLHPAPFGHDRQVLLGYAAFDGTRIRQAVDTLAAALDPHLTGRGTGSRR